MATYPISIFLQKRSSVCFNINIDKKEVFLFIPCPFLQNVFCKLRLSSKQLGTELKSRRLDLSSLNRCSHMPPTAGKVGTPANTRGGIPFRSSQGLRRLRQKHRLTCPPLILQVVFSVTKETSEELTGPPQIHRHFSDRWVPIDSPQHAPGRGEETARGP